MKQWELPSFTTDDSFSEELQRYLHTESEFMPFLELREPQSLFTFKEVTQAAKLAPSNELAIISHPLTYPSRLHQHDYLEIPYILEGRILHIVEQTPYILEAGDFCVLPPYTPHLIAPIDGDSPIVVNILIQQRLLQKISTLVSPHRPWEQLAKPLLWTHENTTATTHQYLQRFIADYYHQSFETNLETVGYLLAFLHQIDSDEKISYDELTKQSLTLIHAQAATITQASLAQQMNYSASYLSRHIKQHTTHTISWWIAKEKLSLAQRLLANTNESIQEIASKTGYQSESHFYRLFKESTGITPRTYRELMKP